MRIQHNIPAMNAYRNFNNNSSALAKNLEKLSSGYRINRAGDDAAGLAISEKMRAQITGLDAAGKNVKDGISLVKTAEGAMQEVHDMLSRMKYLATQSANGTYDNPVDRANLQKEVESLKAEINRIADSANFNGQKLMDGSLANGQNSTVGTQLMDIKASDGTGVRVDAQAAGHVFSAATNNLANNSKFDAFEITFKNAKGETKTITLVEGAKNGAGATGSAIANALNGNGNGLGLTLVGSDEKALAEFRELFDITGSANMANGSAEGIKIQAKDPESGADLVSLKTATGTDSKTAVDGLKASAAKGEDAKSTKAESAGFAITFNGATDGDTVKVGDTVYEFVTAGNAPKTAGAIGVTVAGDTATSVKNLVAQLKKDGFEVEVSKNDPKKLLFTDMSKISEKQDGAQVKASSDNVLITKQEAAKQETTITFGNAGATGAQTLTFNYVDENGKAQSKSLTYDPAATSATAVSKAIYDAMKDDADLVKLFDIKDAAGTLTIKARGTGDNAGVFTGMTLSDNTVTQKITKVDGTYEGKTLELKNGTNLKAGDTITVNGKTYEFTDDTSKPVGSGHKAIALGANGTDTLENLSKALTADGVVHSFDKATGKLTFNDKDFEGMKGGLKLQIGDTADEYNQMTVSVDDMHTDALGIGDLNIGDQEGAAAAIEKINDAINKVSSTRGDLGAIQNRLEHTHNNLSVMKENIQDAESTIRDTDVADEMMKYTKNNILVQASQAMLAQANQLPQGVLQLLQ